VRREEPEGRAKVLRVDRAGGGGFASIRGAVDAAADGQTVEIAGGEYAETLVLQRPIELRAAVDGAVALVASAGETLVTCASAGVRLVGLSLQQTGGDPARRGRSSVRAVEALSGALRLERCTVTSEAGSGIIAADAGIVSLEACTLQGSGKCGLLVFDGGSAAVNSSTLAGNGLYGLVVQNGGTAEAEGSRFRGNKHAGILAHGRGSACAALGSDVSANGEMGIGVQNGAEVRLERTRVAGNIHAGLFVDGEANPPSPPPPLVLSGHAASVTPY
jgi:nitrous oxidase accessory protein NosD